MKKALFVVFAIALLVWMASWFRSEEAVATSAARPWPGGMGSLDSAGARVPQLHANEASRRLLSLAGALPKSEAVQEFVSREIARGQLTIGAPPPLPDVSAIRELLLREPIVWELRVGFDDGVVASRRVVQMNVARTLVADALSKARTGDPSSWEDLHAVWNLARSLDAHPQTMAQTAAMTMSRMVNAVAWKLPLPAPQWFAEVRERDHVRPLLEAFQYQAASYGRDGAQLFPTKWLANSVEHDRRIAEDLSRTTQCDVTARANELGVDLTSVWRRAFRFRAEREATANALLLREGRAIETSSVCSDGTWSVEGATLRFSREIAPGSSENAMPLALSVARE